MKIQSEKKKYEVDEEDNPVRSGSGWSGKCAIDAAKFKNHRTQTAKVLTRYWDSTKLR